MNVLHTGWLKQAITGMALTLPLTWSSFTFAEEERPQEEDIEKITVYSERLFRDTQRVSPTRTVTAEDLDAVSFITSEDAIAHQPSIVVRRRFIGDPNGVIGIRGSNPFQGSRSMVFVDGMPLHYHLQTRWSGSPRWSLVAPGEIEQVDIVYGPFSAEYSGNAMGGVVNIKSKAIESREVVIQTSLFSQDYDTPGRSDTYNGGKFFASFADNFDGLSVYAAYNHLQNDSQPMSFFESPVSESEDGTAVAGAVKGIDEKARQVAYYGDSGAEEATTDLLTLKLGYEWDDFQARANIAWEQRDREESDRRNYLTDANGNPLWNGTANIDGEKFSVRGSNFQHRYQDRDSLLIGLGLSGLLADGDWAFDSFYSYFDIVKDEEVRTARNPLDPDYQAQNEAFRGRLTEYDDTGWQIFDLKVGTEKLAGDENQRLSVGFHWDSYELNIIADDYNAITHQRAADELDGDLTTGRGDSGGESSTFALFLQYGYALSEQWDVALGLRYEDWEATDGYAGGTDVQDRDDTGWSPKFSLGYFPADNLSIRYSIAKALRFPIVEELYRNDGATSDGSVFISDPSLKPEDGIFQNLGLEFQTGDHQLNVNVFYDVIDDVIFNQSTRTDISTVTTSLPTEEVTTKGAEFIWRKANFLVNDLTLNFNVTYNDTEITENVLNPDIVGNDFPRIPEWRANMVAHYQLSDDWDVAANIRYASNSYGQLDNSDTVSNVFGAQDDYLFVGAKANYYYSENLKFSIGMDNITDDEAYVFHPWPGRTVYLEAQYRFGE